jgi:hypothetical protein
MFAIGGHSYAAIWKRMADKEKRRLAEIAESRSATP